MLVANVGLYMLFLQFQGRLKLNNNLVDQEISL